MPDHIKLDSTLAVPMARAVITLESLGEAPGISLTVAEGGRFNEKDDWVTDDSHRKQTIQFMGQKGPVTMAAQVPTEWAVEIPAAHRVTVIVGLRTSLKATREAGGVSGAYTGLELQRVVEIYDRPGIKRWTAKDWAPEPAGAGKVLTPGGKIVTA